MGEALFRECADCVGDGKYHRAVSSGYATQTEYGNPPPTECQTCKGWGIEPSGAGQAVFDLVNAMRKAGAKHWPEGS